MNGTMSVRQSGDRLEDTLQEALMPRVKTLDLISQALGSLQRFQKIGSKNYFREIF